MENNSFEMISLDDAKDIIKDEDSLILDIRDEASYSDSHYPNAIHLSNKNFNEVIEKTERKKPFLCIAIKASQVKMLPSISVILVLKMFTV